MIMTTSPQSEKKDLVSWAFERSSRNIKIITNLEYQIVSVNKAFLDWFDFTEEEVIGQSADTLQFGDLVEPDLNDQIPLSLETYGEWKGEIISRTRRGLSKPCLIAIVSIYSPGGEKVGYHAEYTDLTERKNLEYQLIQGEKLASIGESVATLMHEVRNPLSGIAMNAFMLEAAARNGKEWVDGDVESIQLIAKEVRRLEALVKNALNFARDIQLHPEKILLMHFFEELKAIVISQAFAEGVGLLVETVPEGLVAIFDPDPMKQVLLNLIQNAIEAASSSTERLVRIAVSVKEDPQWQYISASSRVLLFSVDNTGGQITEQNTKNLFKPFFTSKEKGIGLGLAISSKIVRQHHGILGHFHLDEHPYSTRFTVALPI
jgi:PAS domain S-box-containing protein